MTVPLVSEKVKTPFGSCQARREPSGEMFSASRCPPAVTMGVLRKEAFSHQGFWGSSGSALITTTLSPQSDR